MARKMNVRIAVESLELADAARGYTGETRSAYVSRVLLERAKEDIDRLHKELEERMREQPNEPKIGPNPKK